MALTLTSFDAFLKDYYEKRTPEQLVYKNRPLLALLKKKEKFPGRRMPIPVLTSNPQSRSADFATTQTIAAATSSRVDAFYLTRVKNYGTVTIDTEAMEASGDDEGAWLEAKTTEIDGILNTLANDTAYDLFRGGFGARGTVGSGTASPITLSVISDVHGWEVGMQFHASSTESTAVLRAGTGTVTAVNRRTGVITFSGTITGLAVSDVLFLSGDRQDSATPSRLKLTGLAGWCPSTAPSGGESFYGQDRSVDSRLYGNFYNGSSEPIEDALIEAANRPAELGFGLTHYIVSYPQWSKLTKNIHDSRRYIEVKEKTTEIGFPGFTIQGPMGPITVLADQNCQRNTAWGLNMEYCALYTIGKAIRLIENDGQSLLRQSNADGVEVRAGLKGQFGCTAPASLVQVTLATV